MNASLTHQIGGVLQASGGSDSGTGKAGPSQGGGVREDPDEPSIEQFSGAEPGEAASGTPAIREGSQHIALRALRVLVLLAFYFVLELVVKAITIAQFLHWIWRKQPHPGMQWLGGMIAEYMKVMWEYCTFASDDRPWPFSPWPRRQSEGHQEDMAG